MNIDKNGPIGLWLAEQAATDPMKLRLGMAMRCGFEIIVPDRVFPKFKFEPITEADLMGIAHSAYWYKRANISKLRKIIRNAKIHNG